MDNTIQLQLDISKGLLAALDTLVGSYESMYNMTANQTSEMQNLLRSMQKSDDMMDAAASDAENMSREMSQSVTENYSRNFDKQSKDAVSAINKSSKDSQNRTKKSQNATDQNLNIASSLKEDTKKINKSLKGLEGSVNNLDSAIDQMSDVVDSTELAKEGNGFLRSAIDALLSIGKSIVTGGTSLLVNGFTIIKSFLKSSLTIITSMISAGTKFFTFTMTVPFTIAKAAANIGNTIRRDLVEVIQAAGEDAKESFDLTSHIGQGAAKMTQMSKGLLKQFNTPRSRLSKLFGMGASGIASFQKETFKLVEGMGHYSEVFGSTIMKDLKVAQALIEAQRAMGLNAQQMAYYAQEAYNSGKDPTSLLIEIGTTLKKTAKDNGLDFKALSKEFHVLRTNIVDFGNLTSNEIMGLTVKLRKMGVKTDDAVNVFKKFTSLEEAAKASAMLFQSFEMNVDAFDLLTSRDPGEMLTQFKEAMFQTGRSFKDLNRHEKALMQNITGISENGLNSLMNYMTYGLTYDEARKRMEEQDPTAQQTKMIKGLTSTIKMVQKTMMFNSPFDAFFKGLTNNAANQNELKNSVISLSKIYDDIYHLGLSLNLDEIKSFLVPITVILTKVKNTLTSSNFKKALKGATKLAGDFLGDVGNDLQNKTAKEYYKFGIKIQEMTELAGKDGADLIKSAENLALESLLGMTQAGTLNKSILDELISKGVLKKVKNGVLKIVDKLSLTSFLTKMQKISNTYSPNSPVQKEIAKIRQKVEESYDAKIKTFAGNFEENLEKANQKANDRTTISGRIDNIYEQLSNLVNEGSPMFNSIMDIGGRIMGATIKGMMYGIAAGLKLMSGSIEMAVDALGIDPQSKVLEEAAKKAGKSVDQLSAFDLMGISATDKEVISEELGKESSRMVLNLPSFMSMAGSFLGDLSEVFVQFAGGIVGVIGDFTYKYYKASGMFTRIAMKAGGFDPDKAIALSALNKIYEKDDIIKQIASVEEGLAGARGMSEDDYQNKFDESVKEKYDPVKSKVLLRMLDKYKKNFDIRTTAFKLINDSQNILKDANVSPGRLTNAIYSIISSAENINSYLPSRLFEKYKNNEEAIKILLKKDKNIYNIKLAAESTIDILKKETGGTWLTNLETFKGPDKSEHYITSISSHRSSLPSREAQIIQEIDEKLAQNKDSDNVVDQAAEDYHFKGKGAILSIGNYRYHLHDHDAIYAAKKGGFLNKIYIEIFETYNLFTQDLLNVFNQRIVETNKVITEAKSTISSLKNSTIQNTEYNNEASAEEILDIFNLCLDVVNESLNKKSVSRNVKAQIAV